MKIEAKQIQGLVNWLGSFTAALASRPMAETIAVTNLANEAIVTHNLNSDTLIAHFLINGRTQQGFDFEPISQNSIRVYLPILDGPTQTFTGKIFLIKVG